MSASVRVRPRPSASAEYIKPFVKFSKSFHENKWMIAVTVILSTRSFSQCLIYQYSNNQMYSTHFVFSCSPFYL